MPAGRETEQADAFGVDAEATGIVAQQVEGAAAIPHGDGIAVGAVVLHQAVIKHEGLDVVRVCEVLGDGLLLPGIGQVIVAATRNDEDGGLIRGFAVGGNVLAHEGDVAAGIITHGARCPAPP